MCVCVCVCVREGRRERVSLCACVLCAFHFLCVYTNMSKVMFSSILFSIQALVECIIIIFNSQEILNSCI